MDRRPYARLWEELSRSKAMVFLSGPRQVGKTTLAKAIAARFPASLYFNWDVRDDRARLLKDPSFFTKLDNPGTGPALASGPGRDSQVPAVEELSERRL